MGFSFPLGKVITLEEKVSQLREGEFKLRKVHTQELAQMQQRLRSELEAERGRLLNQIRELTRLKEEASAEVRICTCM